MDKKTKADSTNTSEGFSMKTTRREFLKGSALATGGLALSLMSDDAQAGHHHRPEPMDLSDRATRIALAYETMLTGMIVSTGISPQVMMRTGSIEINGQVSIDTWMASAASTDRLRALMGIDGDTVGDMMKSLQLDVGFVHQYMNVSYTLIDDNHGEFWLNFCGALMNAEPQGEALVYNICHTIEDPTFDATAFTTNPHARIRPIHRPPRDPADRVPHCHWTIEIDPGNEPGDVSDITRQVAELPMLQVPIIVPENPSDDGMTDYQGDFKPDFTLFDLSTDLLPAVQEEFASQANLLMASGELALAKQFDGDTTRQIMENAWEGCSWITSKRLAAAIGLDETPDITGIAAVLSEHPFVPSGFIRQVFIESKYVIRMVLTPQVEGVLDPNHPGIQGLMASGVESAWNAMVQAVNPRSRLADLVIKDDKVIAVFVLMPVGDPVSAPVSTMYMQGLAVNWVFNLQES